jgi:hypothetical protein
MINELFLQTLLANKLLAQSNFVGTNNEAIEIMSIGELNKDSGPDFFNSKVKVNEILLAGNIEVHVKSSDWLKHKHQSDKAYDNIILHIVFEHDKDIEQNLSHNVSVLELKNYIPQHVLTNYQNLAFSKNKIPCGASILSVNEMVWKSWLNRLMVSKLEDKTKTISNLFNYLECNYDETLYITLIRNFGFKVNNDAFELLGKSLPFKVLKKYADNLVQLEALLFGTAGLLNDTFDDKYLKTLQNEYEFLKRKHKLSDLSKEIWKFSKTRPVNFPTIRIAQFAALIHKQTSFYHFIENKPNIKQLKTLFDIDVSEYWQHHYVFDDVELFKKKPLGKTSFELIVINSIVPFLFFMSKQDDSFIEYAFDLLTELSPEENSKTNEYYKLGIKIDNSFESQALIYMYDSFCSKKACLHCGIGNDLLKSKAS